MSRLTVYGIIFALILGICGFFGWRFYADYYTAAAHSPQGEYSIVVKSGQSMKQIGSQLYTDKILNNADSLNFHNQFHPVNNLQTGNFKIHLPATPKDILAQIDSDNQEKIKTLAETKKPSQSVTFKEGITADQVLDLLASKKLGDRATLAKFIQNPSNFDRSKYSFLPALLSCNYGDKANCAKYYLEGFLYPDTYTFYNDATPAQIFEKFLDNFNTKVWNGISSKPTTAEFNNKIVEASIIERETGRPLTGITNENQNEIETERKNVASVINNRIAAGMLIESNPTVGYFANRGVCEQTLIIENCIMLDDTEANNLYNTYNNKGLPIGPITSPTLDSIEAALHPNQNNYLYFVAEKNGKTYFAADEAGHAANIEKVKEINAN